jgi:hypothetical protein
MHCVYKCFDVGEYKGEMVKKFLRLVVCFTSQNEGPQEIQGRIETANRDYFPVLQLTLRPGISWGVPVMHLLPLCGIIVLYGS